MRAYAILGFLCINLCICRPVREKYSLKMTPSLKLCLVSPLGILLGFLFLYTSADSDNYYNPFPTSYLHRMCAKNCSVALGECDEENIVDSYCRCDEKCVIYGDCCWNAPICNVTDVERNTADQLGGLLQCRSIFPYAQRFGRVWIESRIGWVYTSLTFWMVSACPRDWMVGRDEPILLDILNNCTNGSISLPPVTDVSSGIVYKNEYCAVCHGIEIFQPWGYHFVCNYSDPLDLQIPSLNEYSFIEILQSPGINISEILKQYCSATRFTAPQGPSPRACFHDSLVDDTCLEREELQNKTSIPIDEEQYQELVKQCKNGPINPFGYNSPFITPFKNLFCAICNGTDLADDVFLQCSNRYNQFNNNMVYRPSIYIFSIFLDVNRDSIIILTHTRPINVTTSCPDGKVFDPFDHNCRTTICPESTGHGERPCSIISMLNSTLNDSECFGALIPLEKEDNFTILANNKTLLLHDEIYNIIGYVNNSLPIICTDFKQNGTHQINVTVTTYSYPAAFSIVTYVGCSLSVIGCAFVLLTYSLFKELRTLPGKILMNLAAAILGTCVFLLIGIPLFELAEKEELCHTTAILLHWLVLSQFSWMTIMSFELARSLFRATCLQPVHSPEVKKQIFIVYMLIGWGLPTIITGVSVAINYTTDYIEYGEDDYCWISHVTSFYIVFLAPVALSILVNAITFSVTTYLLFNASRDQAKLEKQNNISYMRIYVSVFSITGLTWIVGFVAILARGEWAWYLFIILTSTQGFVICAAFIFTKKVSSLYKQSFWLPISRSFSFRSSSRESTQVTSVVSQHGGKGEKVSVVSSQNPGDVCEMQETAEEQIHVYSTKNEEIDHST